MEEKFLDAWLAARERIRLLGIRLRPLERQSAMEAAHRCLQGCRESDGFAALAEKGLLAYSLEALAVDRRFTGLFSDEEANEALQRLLNAGYGF